MFNNFRSTSGLPPFTLLKPLQILSKSFLKLSTIYIKTIQKLEKLIQEEYEKSLDVGFPLLNFSFVENNHPLYYQIIKSELIPVLQNNTLPVAKFNERVREINVKLKHKG